MFMQNIGPSTTKMRKLAVESCVDSTWIPCVVICKSHRSSLLGPVPAENDDRCVVGGVYIGIVAIGLILILIGL
jgi:hypothetical protein